MMRPKKSEEAAPVALVATSAEAPQTASEAIPENEAGPPVGGDSIPSMMVGTSPQHDEYAEGREALAELCEDTKRKLSTLLKLGRAFMKGRGEAMRIGKTNKPEGKRYCKALNKILKREELHKFESGQRRDLFRIVEHEAEIKAFLESRDPSERILNNPTSIIRAWRKTSAGADALFKEKPIFKKIKRAALQKQVEQRDARIEELEQERDQLKREATPQFGEPRLVALVRGGPLKVEDLGDLTRDEWTAFVSRTRQLMDESEQPAAKRRSVN
jgi:hypothetical protein